MKCLTCKRDGAHPVIVLSGKLWRTFQLCHGNTAPEISRMFVDEVGYTACNNRLERLRKLGLVRRERDGRAWRYFAIKQ